MLPELVLHNTDSKDSLGLNYMGLIPVLVNSTREQQAEIEREQADLKLQAKQIAAQQLVISRQQEQTKQEQAQLHRQKAQLDALKRLICSLHPSASACQ